MSTEAKEEVKSSTEVRDRACMRPIALCQSFEGLASGAGGQTLLTCRVCCVPTPLAHAAACMQAAPAPVFGSSGGGFAGFTGAGFGAFSATSSAPAAAKGEEEEGGDDGPAVEEECQAEFKPLVHLDEVETSTGEEEEASLLEL
jgi:hypothetical protein